MASFFCKFFFSFWSFSRRRGEGLGTNPRAVSPLIELELCGRNERAARHETKRLVYKLKVLGQLVTDKVRSKALKRRKHFSAKTRFTISFC